MLHNLLPNLHRETEKFYKPLKGTPPFSLTGMRKEIEMVMYQLTGPFKPPFTFVKKSLLSEAKERKSMSITRITRYASVAILDTDFPRHGRVLWSPAV